MLKNRLFGLALATIAASTPALAQRCLGLGTTGKNYLGAEQRQSWTGHGTLASVVGLQYTHRIEAGSNTSVLVNLSGATGHVHGDTTAAHVAASLAVSRQVTAISPNLSVCASGGIEARAVDYPGEGDGFASFPITTGVGYDVRLGAVTLTPFVAPTIAYYEFESKTVQNRARQRGWDGFVTTGITAAVGRYSFGANWRRGDVSLGDTGRFAFTTGVSF